MKQTRLLLLMSLFVGTMYAMSDSEDSEFYCGDSPPLSPLARRRSPLTRRKRVELSENSVQEQERLVDEMLGDPHEYPMMRDAAKMAAALGLSYGAYRLWLVCLQSMQQDNA